MLELKSINFMRKQKIIQNLIYKFEYKINVEHFIISIEYTFNQIERY